MREILFRGKRTYNGDDGFYSLGHLGDCVEVIGNIYDNPELLK